MKKALAILLVALTVLTFAACSRKETDDQPKSGIPVAGTWEIDLKSYASEEELAQIRQSGVTVSISYRFKEDGTGHEGIDVPGQKEERDFTYTYENGTLTIDGEPIVCTVKDNVMRMERDGKTLIFTRTNSK